jgi:predicted heme/steroid binding protein/uncharacterized membrane protein
MREFTLEELERHNGQDLPTVYLACAGKVYDVSESGLWSTGLHMNRHRPGADLTEEIKGAPHGEEMLQRFPQVGTLREGEDRTEERIPPILAGLLEKIPLLRRHPHPMTIHFPLVFSMVFPLFNLLYFLTGYLPFERTAFHLLILCLPAVVVGVTTGPYTWWLNYGSKLNPEIKAKLLLSLILLLLVLVALIWRLAVPEVLLAGGTAGLLYLLISCAMALTASLIGWFGAKLTFPI